MLYKQALALYHSKPIEWEPDLEIYLKGGANEKNKR